MFEASEMVGEVEKDLMDLKVDELRDELAARGGARRGRKPDLRVRLRALMIRAALDQREGMED